MPLVSVLFSGSSSIVPPSAACSGNLSGAGVCPGDVSIICTDACGLSDLERAASCTSELGESGRDVQVTLFDADGLCDLD